MAKNTIDTRAGMNIRSLRKKRGFSQEELAFRAGCDVSTIGRIERGGMSPTLETLARLAGALDVDAVMILQEQEKAGSLRAETMRTFQMLLKKSDTKTIRLVLQFLLQILKHNP